MALPGEELRAVEAEGFYADEDMTCFWHGNRASFKLEDFWAAGLVDYCGAHGCHFGGGGWFVWNVNWDSGEGFEEGNKTVMGREKQKGMS
jgi:hypothetical protein